MSKSSHPRHSDVEQIIATAEIDTTFGGRKYRYRGRRSTWPGAVGLFLLFAGSLFCLVYFGHDLHISTNNKVDKIKDLVSKDYGVGQIISDGHNNMGNTSVEVANPEHYVDKKCQQPNYVSKNGLIVAKFKGGDDVKLNIKGVNWLGAEQLGGVPEGLWDSTRSGSTVYRIGEFLSLNKFNAVRLPLSVDAIINGANLDRDKVNTNSNRALDLTNYVNMIGSLSQGLGQFGIGVVLDFHVLSFRKDGNDTGLWYSNSIHIEDIENAIDILAKKLCTSTYFNIMGIDLKDSPSKASWGDGSNTDWQVAATTLGNRMLDKCSNWLAFVQGVEGPNRKVDFGDRSIKFKPWAGADLSGVQQKPMELSKPSKVVYAPPYYSSAKQPQVYMFDAGNPMGERLANYTESDNATLEKNVLKSMDLMFGAALDTQAAVVLPAFGGLVGKSDLTNKKTSARVVDIIVKKMLGQDKPLAGGFWWSLNPVTQWNYPLPNATKPVFVGLLDDSYRQADLDILASLQPMDSLPQLHSIPCVH